MLGASPAHFGVPQLYTYKQTHKYSSKQQEVRQVDANIHALWQQSCTCSRFCSLCCGAASLIMSSGPCCVAASSQQLHLWIYWPLTPQIMLTLHWGSTVQLWLRAGCDRLVKQRCVCVLRACVRYLTSTSVSHCVTHIRNSVITLSWCCFLLELLSRDFSCWYPASLSRWGGLIVAILVCGWRIASSDVKQTAAEFLPLWCGFTTGEAAWCPTCYLKGKQAEQARNVNNWICLLITSMFNICSSTEP